MRTNISPACISNPRRKAGFALAAAIPLLMLPGIAAAKDTRERVEKSAVGDQEITVRTAYNLDKACKSVGETRMAIIAAPKNGTLTSRMVDLFPSFKKDNDRFVCNDKLAPAIGAFYKAKPGFTGTDRFSFTFVFEDGESWRYDVTMKVIKP
jgi:hypothetical protein